jgi:hypothetical protein
MDMEGVQHKSMRLGVTVRELKQDGGIKAAAIGDCDRPAVFQCRALVYAVR